MTGIALLQTDDRHAETASAGRMSINALNSGDTEFIQIIPNASRANDREKAALFVGRVIGHQCIRENWIIAVMNRGDFHQWAARFRPAIVTGKFAEWSFALDRVWINDSFNHEFGVGR